MRRHNPPHRDIRLRSNVGVLISPYLAGIVLKDDPLQVRLDAIVNQEMRQPLAARGHQRQGWVNANDHFPVHAAELPCKLSWQLLQTDFKSHAGGRQSKPYRW